MTPKIFFWLMVLIAASYAGALIADRMQEHNGFSPLILDGRVVK